MYTGDGTGMHILCKYISAITHFCISGLDWGSEGRGP
jgi:hypothetical protein